MTPSWPTTNGSSVFTGIVEDMGTIEAVTPGSGGGRVLSIRTGLDPATIAVGDSICTNGVCLTATSVRERTFSVDVGPETLSRTTIGLLQRGMRVNLERSVTPSTRLGGHLVMGHVDAVGTVRTVTARENAWDLAIEAPPEVLKLVIPRGSVAVDGISLTVTARDAETFGLSIIPHTWKVTTMAGLKPRGSVNLEVDVIARYVDGLLGFAQPANPGAEGRLTEEILKKHGW